LQPPHLPDPFPPTSSEEYVLVVHRLPHIGTMSMRTLNPQNHIQRGWSAYCCNINPFEEAQNRGLLYNVRNQLGSKSCYTISSDTLPKMRMAICITAPLQQQSRVSTNHDLSTSQ
jgi:hypothetical protein